MPTVAAVLVALVCARLGVWQLDRGHAKQELIDQRTAAAQQAPQRVHGADRLAALTGQRVELYGTWQPDRQVLLDSQVSSGRVGVHVWTPLRLDDGALVLVDRGWVATPVDRSASPDLPAVTPGVIRIRGIWRELPQPGLRTSRHGCQVQRWPARLLYPTTADLQCQFGETVAAGVLLLDPDAADGFERLWADVGLPPERHYGYAVQWFALAVTVLVIWFILLIRTLKHGDR